MDNGLESRQRKRYNANSCDKENINSRDPRDTRALPSPRNKQQIPLTNRHRPLCNDPTLTSTKSDLLKHRDRLLRQKLSFSSMFNQLRKEKDLLIKTNTRLLDQQQYYNDQIHNVQKEHLALYRRNQREKESLMEKLQLLREMDPEVQDDSRVSEVESELEKVKELFYQQERVNAMRYEELVSESRGLQEQNRKMREFIQEKRGRIIEQMNFKAT